MTSQSERQWHRKMAAELFNSTWRLIAKKRRTKDEDDRMIHMAHASRYHWSVVGGSKEAAIGEWQISHVYALLRRPEPALYHAPRSPSIPPPREGLRAVDGTTERRGPRSRTRRPRRTDGCLGFVPGAADRRWSVCPRVDRATTHRGPRRRRSRTRSRIRRRGSRG